MSTNANLERRSTLTSRNVLTLALILAVASSGCLGDIVRGNGQVVGEQRQVSPFGRVETSGSFDVNIAKSGMTMVVLRGESNLLSLVVTESDGETLHLYLRDGASMSTTAPITISVSTPSLEGLETSGSGDVTARGFSSNVLSAESSGSGALSLEVRAVELDLECSGSGDTSIEGLVARRVELDLSGSGDVTLQGAAQTLEVESSGSGDVEAQSFIARDADLDLSGSGSVRVQTQAELRGRISGSGDATIIGNPHHRNIDSSGSGRFHFN